MWAEFRVIVLEFVPPLGDFFQGVSRLSESCRIGAWGYHLGVYLDGAVRTYASRIFRLAGGGKTWFAGVGVAWLLSEGVLCPVFGLRRDARGLFSSVLVLPVYR